MRNLPLALHALPLPTWVAPWLAARPSRIPLERDRARLAIDLACENVRRRTGGPFGAAVFELGSGRLLAAGVNLVRRSRTSVAHAEVLALSLAQQRLGTHDLGSHAPGCELASSAMMCAMCAGAVAWSGVRRVVTSASRADVERLLGFDEGPGHPVRELRRRGIEVRTGVERAASCRALAAYASSGGVLYSPTRR